MSAPIGLQVGETYEDGGRMMIVDKVLEDGSYIVHAEGFKEPEAPKPDDEKARLREEIETEIRAELEEKIRAEVMAELGDRLQPVTGANEGGQAADHPPEAELKCRYCGKPYKEASWLASHEEKCPQNPANAGK